MVRLGSLDFELKVRGRGTSGSPVIFPSAGWGIDCDLKFAGLEPLFHDHKFMCMVTRGTYPSSRPAKDSHMSSTHMIHDLEMLRLWLGLDNLRLFGHSIGGTISLGYAQLFPDHVSSLLLADSKMLDHDDMATLMDFVRHRSADPRYASSLRALTIAGNFSDPEYPRDDAAYQDLLVMLLPWYFSDPARYTSTYAAVVRSYRPPQNWATIVHDRRNAAEPTPNKALLSKVVAPTLVIVGEADAFCSRAVAEIMHAGIRDSRLVVYQDCGHLPWVEKKDEFYKEVKAWWHQHP